MQRVINPIMWPATPSRWCVPITSGSRGRRSGPCHLQRAGAISPSQPESSVSLDMTRSTNERHSALRRRLQAVAGEHIRKRRFDLKMTGRQLLEIDNSTLTKWEQSRQEPNKENRQKILRFLVQSARKTQVTGHQPIGLRTLA